MGELRSDPDRAELPTVGVIDDHTRLAYCGLHGSENAITV